MKKQSENICKFVTEQISSPLSTSNFVFEKNIPESGYEIIKSFDTMYLCVSGEATLLADPISCDISVGTLFFTFPGEKTVLTDNGGFEYMYITFSGSKAEELYDRFGVSRVCRSFNGFEGLISFWQNALGKANARNLDLLSESVLLYTFSQMSHSTDNTEQFLVGSIINHVESHHSDPSLSLTTTAEALGYNPKYLSRVFSKNVGVTFSEYLKNARIKHAVFLMESGVTAVKNVALLSGYSDPLYFSNVFKSCMGLSPSKFLEKIYSEEQQTK